MAFTGNSSGSQPPHLASAVYPPQRAAEGRSHPHFPKGSGVDIMPGAVEGGGGGWVID